jgi:hypothetical protein
MLCQLVGLGRASASQPRECRLRVETTSSSREGAVVDTASRLAVGQRPLHLEQRPFETASGAGPNGRLVPVSVSTPAGHQRRQPLHNGC